MSFLSLINFSVVSSILLVVAFAGLRWLDIPTGNLVDWLVGLASFWWLVVIVTIPWNIYFDAKEVTAEAAISRQNNITVDSQQTNYVNQVQRWSLVIAIALHLISAIALYTIAFTGISVIGYVSSAATLLLTGLRPAGRAYEYISQRLTMIKQQIKYPREDVLAWQSRILELESKVNLLEDNLNLSNTQGWAAGQTKQLEYTYQELMLLKAGVAQFQATNQVEHQEISQQAQNTVAQLAEDSRFLSQVREIIRFLKTA